MTVRDTSMDAYIGINEDGSARTKRGQIYNHLRRNQALITRTELSEALGIPINSICGRVNELIKCGAVIEHGRRDCRVTGKSAYQLALR